MENPLKNTIKISWKSHQNLMENSLKNIPWKNPLKENPFKISWKSHLKKSRGKYHKTCLEKIPLKNPIKMSWKNPLEKSHGKIPEKNPFSIWRDFLIYRVRNLMGHPAWLIEQEVTELESLHKEIFKIAKEIGALYLRSKVRF